MRRSFHLCVAGLVCLALGLAGCPRDEENVQVPVQIHVPAEPDPFAGLTTLRANVLRGGSVVATLETPATETRIEIPGVPREGGLLTIQIEGIDASGAVLARGSTRNVDPYDESGEPFGLMFLRVGTFSRLEAALPVDTAGTGVVVRNQNAFLFGGDAGSGPLGDVWVYNLDSAKIASLPQMAEARANAGGIVLDDGRLLVIGGSDGAGLPLGSTEVYDPVAVTWSPGPTLNYARIGPQVFPLSSGRVLVAGAMDSPVPCEILDVAANSATDVSGTSPRQVPTAVLRADGSVLVAGGFDGTDELSTSEVVGSDGTATAVAEGLRVPRLGAVSALASDGTVWIAGGQRGPAFPSERYVSSAEWIDADGSTGGFAGDRLVQRRAYSAALALADGVLVMGGSDGANIDRAEWFDAGRFVDAGTTLRARTFPALAVLADGTGIVAGGGSGALEVYQPGTLPDLAARVDLQLGTTIPPAPSPNPFAGATTAVYTIFDAAGPIAEVEIDPSTAPAPGSNAQPGPFAVFNGFRIDDNVAARIEARDAVGNVLSRGGHVRPITSTIYETGTLGLYLGRLESWSVAAAAMGHPREDGQAVALPDGRLLVVGGTGSGPDTAEPFDPHGGVFDPLLNAGTSRGFVRAVELGNGSVLVTGDGAGGTTAVDIYDPDAGAFAGGDPLTDTRSYHSLTLMADGRVVAIGGRVGPGEDDDVVGTAEVWDAGAWGAPIAMGEPRQRHSAALRGDGMVVVAGGQRIVQVAQPSPMGSDSPLPPVPSPEVIALTELFNGTSFAPGPDLVSLRRDHAMISLPDGGVMVCGGVDFASQQGPGNNLDTCETLAMGGAAWQAQIALQTPRDDLLMLLLHDGRVLAIGGSSAGAVTDVDVVWTMDGDLPAPGPALNIARRSHMGAVLPDGRAVVFGGAGGGAGLDSAEIFTPAVWTTPFGY